MAYKFGRQEVPIPPELLATEWLAAPAGQSAEAGVNRYLEYLRSRTPELQREFPGQRARQRLECCA